ncbi:MAG: STAS domain-containing protein [Planctomycetota bacterium]|nr:STAS domain-containing protein [Planctomycetota bacterium]
MGWGGDDIRRTKNGRLEILISFHEVPKPVVALMLRGEVDDEGAQLLKTVLDEARSKEIGFIILNTASLTKINSSGISALLASKSLSLTGGPQIVLVSLSKALRFPLEQLGAIPLFQIFDDMPSALEFIGKE